MANQTILLIDPDTRNLSVMEVQLRKHGYTVQTASEISQALQIIRVTPPDLIICEADVKGESGLELCERLKGEVATSETPFIILSADLGLKVNALETGADDFLAKPVYVGELKDRLEVVLQKKKAAGP
jgi:DNA-binding response OmpR family regulator